MVDFKGAELHLKPVVDGVFQPTLRRAAGLPAVCAAGSMYSISCLNIRRRLISICHQAISFTTYLDVA